MASFFDLFAPWSLSGGMPGAMPTLDNYNPSFPIVPQQPNLPPSAPFGFPPMGAGAQPPGFVPSPSSVGQPEKPRGLGGLFGEGFRNRLSEKIGRGSCRG